MCGISGIVTDRLTPESARQAVRAMNDLQRHRGPDDDGVWDDEHAFFGHRRLAIIDLSSCGAQPMTNEDGSLVLVCNGEIYNFHELRDRLRSNGHRFRSETDIEVILHLYEEHGDRCVDTLAGMFAFALWDRRRRRLLLARDRIGEKPLYYAQVGAGIAFASEVAALLKVPGVSAAFDEEALASALVYPSVPAPMTMFAGVRAVEPASCVVFENAALSQRRYWWIDCRAGVAPRAEAEAAAELDALLARAVRGALIADVPVGVLLSGGVDSAAIAVHATRAGADIHAFSVAGDSPGRPDPDLARAREVAQRLRLPHHEIPFTALDLGELPAMVARYAQPFNVFPMLYADQLARRVRAHVTVALGGNGADEAFGGYRGYNRHLALDRFAAVLRRLPRAAVKALPAGGDRVMRLRAAAAAPVEERRGAALNELSQQLGSALFTPEFAARAASHRPGDRVTRYARECRPRDYLDTVMYSDLMLYHQHGTTVITDVSGMSHSLEIRAPFLDHRLLEFAFALPRRLKIPSLVRPSRNKYLLKRTLEQALPHSVLYGRKFGFGYNISAAALLAREWRGAVERFVRRGRYLELGIYSRQGADWAIAHAPAEVWRLLVFAIWAELFVFHEPVGAIAARINDALGQQQVA